MTRGFAWIRTTPNSPNPATPNGASLSRNRSAAAISAACFTAGGTAGQPNTPVTWMRS